jgi:hypothetical protein
MKTNRLFVHYHHERHYQGRSNLLLFDPNPAPMPGMFSKVRRKERLGELLSYYNRAA